MEASLDMNGKRSTRPQIEPRTADHLARLLKATIEAQSCGVAKKAVLPQGKEIEPLSKTSKVRFT
jgi:hypothetical protein